MMNMKPSLQQKVKKVKKIHDKPLKFSFKL